MSYKTSKILAYVIVIILYVISLSITLWAMYTVLNSLIGLITVFSMSDALISLVSAIFFYWIYKTN